MKQMLINSMISFTLGTGATLVALSTWLGSTDLQTIEQAVQQYTLKADGQVSALLGEYNVTVNNANAEIGEYKDALAQANSNIDKLITAYEDKVDEVEQAEQDLSDLQVKLGEMQTRLDSQYETDMNAKIQEANVQIEKANQEVQETRVEVQGIIGSSGISQFTVEQHKEHLNQLDTTGSKEVTDISSIVPSEQQGE